MKWIVRFSWLLPIIIIFVMLWIKTGNWIVAGQSPAAKGEKDYAIILGAKVNGTVPSLSLQYRLEAALEYANAYPHVHFILSGGQGPDEDISEAEAMKQYLLNHGISEDRLLIEDQSTSTYENILYSKRLLPDSVTGITIITSDYHLARAQRIANDLGLETDVVSAKTPQVVEKKLKSRERFALLKTVIFGK